MKSDTADGQANGVDSRWSSGRLRFWLRMDTWTRDQAAALLVNIDPDSIRYDEGDDDEDPKIRLCFELDDVTPVSDDEDAMQLQRLRRNLRDIVRIADSASDADVAQRRSPAEWIEWALAKQLTIPWLNWAKANRLVDAEPDGDSGGDAREKPLAQRERTTLLVMVAALADELKIDLNQTSKAALTIERITDLFGARVAARTVEEHLKRIPDAKERRAKE